MNNATALLQGMLDFAQAHGLIEAEDRAYARNLLLGEMGLSAPEAGGAWNAPLPPTLTPFLEALEDIAAERGMIEDGADARERFGVRLCGCVTAHPATVRAAFWALYDREGPRAATAWFYDFCRACDYIRVDHIAKNVRFMEKTDSGELEITINLSKPEKDPRDIARALSAPKLAYPQCMLCVENPGYAGRPGYPARQNHRIVPVTLGGDAFYLQYSPYLYYDEHMIVLNREHRPMKVDHTAFCRLFDFVEQFPHYFLGSNADLPIVGGSILSHDHFQGGNYLFPMDRAGVRVALTAPVDGISACVVDWPMTCIRLQAEDKGALIDAADAMLGAWRAYSDAARGILAQTDAPHNTITPIVRRMEGTWRIDLVLRNNRTDAAHPLGIFHPHPDLHHIKKENIGLIEVMGLFILPGRLLGEMEQCKRYLTGRRPIEQVPGADEPVFKHYEWVKGIARCAGRPLSDEGAQAALNCGLGYKCERVLKDAGVFKADEDGTAGLMQFLKGLGYERAM